MWAGRAEIRGIAAALSGGAMPPRGGVGKGDPECLPAFTVGGGLCSAVHAFSRSGYIAGVGL